MTIEIGDPVPSIKLPATGGADIGLDQFSGKNLVVYFYPKDNTPGCTQEGQDFRDLHAKFQKAGTEILGISRDSVRTHENFAAKFEFPFALLSDKEEVACQAFGVIVEKVNYGRKYMGIDRSTYLFDRNGILREQWRKVRVKGHVQAVLEAAEAL